MADAKISELVAVTTVEDTDEYLVARAGATNKITGANLKAAAGGSQPGAQRWIGPFTLYASKYTTIDPTQNAPGYAVADGGTFKLSYDGTETAAIDFDATAAEVLVALDAIPALTGKIALDTDDHTGSGALGGPLPSAGISFVLDDDVADVQIILSNNSLTSSGNPIDPWPIGATPGLTLTDLGFTPAVGDVIVDFFRQIVSESSDFGQGPQELYLTDGTLSNIINDSPPTYWIAPQSGVVDMNANEDEFTNFSGNVLGLYAPNSAAAADIASGAPFALPAVCRVSVPLRFYYRVSSGPPIAGLVANIWVAVATPDAP